MTYMRIRNNPDVQDLISANYPRVAAILASSLLDVLLVAREDIGDLDSYTILLAAASRACQSPEFMALDSKAYLDGDLTEIPTLPVNARSLADMTGIPKETVRRKVNELIAGGYLRRVGNNLAITPHLVTRIARARTKLIRLAATAHTVVADHL